MSDQAAIWVILLAVFLLGFMLGYASRSAISAMLATQKQVVGRTVPDIRVICPGLSLSKKKKAEVHARG